jgi:hypothetical protein
VHLLTFVPGYNFAASAEKKLPLFAFQMLNGVGDLLDLINAVDPETRPDYDKMSKKELARFLGEKGHCSAMVKVPGTKFYEIKINFVQVKSLQVLEVSLKFQ